MQRTLASGALRAEMSVLKVKPLSPAGSTARPGRNLSVFGLGVSSVEMKSDLSVWSLPEALENRAAGPEALAKDVDMDEDDTESMAERRNMRSDQKSRYGRSRSGHSR